MASLRSLALLALSASILAGCGSDDDEPVVLVDPTVQFTSLVPSTGAAWTFTPEAPAAAIVMPCDGKVALSVATTDFTLKPPGGCGATRACGYVNVTAPTTDPANPPAPVGALAAPVVFTLLPTFAGTGSFVAKIVKDDGTDYLDAMSAPISATLDVTFEAASGCTAE